MPAKSLLVPFLILQALWITYASAREQKGPQIIGHELDHPPANLFYFDDSDTIILHDREAGIVLRSEDAGENWKTVKDVEEGEASDVQRHPFDNRIAYVLGGGKRHWITKDQGKSWTEFETKASPSFFKQPLNFHVSDSDKVLLHTQECTGLFDCEERDYYTTDGFKSIHLLRKHTRDCLFAHSTQRSPASKANIPEDRVFCVVLGETFGGSPSKWPEDRRLFYSDNFFIEETEPLLDGDRAVKGVIKMAMVKDYLVAAAKGQKTSEMALYVTKDASTWHRAEFPKDHKLEEDAYTILESTNYSIQVDVMTTKARNPLGVLFTSNSNGTYFTKNIEHTNRNVGGNVDFEKIQGIQGIVLVNVVQNWEEVTRSSEKKKELKTLISFDDGRTFDSIKSDGDDLHLHSVTDVSNFFGRVYSSPAPGIVMGVGNTGKYLKDYDEGDLYISDDAGLTWSKALEEAHKYEFGDQGAVLVAINDEGPTDTISYSLNHGKSWEKAELGVKVRAKVLTTTPDSTSLKFLLLATTVRGKNFHIFSIDFNGLHERKCEDDDFEYWNARLDKDGKPDCLMGRKQRYRRRKADAICFVDEEFKDPVAEFEDCKCTNEDFECDYNFIKSQDNDECVPAGVMPVPEGQCQGTEDTYNGSSGYRLIPGNNCIREGGVERDKEIKRPCKESQQTPSSGKITHQTSTFSGKYFMEHYYLERADEKTTGTDETVIMRTNEKEIYISKDHGKTWKRELKGVEITAIYPHQYNNDAVYFLTRGKTVWYTINRGDTFAEFSAPHEPTRDKVQIMSFHADTRDWLIWTGAVDCSNSNDDCHSVASYSTSRGAEWHTLLRYVRKCEFIKKEIRGVDTKLEQLVYCEQHTDEKPHTPFQLVASKDWFAQSKVHFPDVIDFATQSEFIIVAAKDPDQKSLKIDTSTDGQTFADALFPPNFKVPHQTAYTVLDSSTHAVFLHVTVEDRDGFEYGSIVKSNSNGTSYVLSLNAVNRNHDGYADFEKMQGLLGVALVNVVANLEASDGDRKKLKSMITHNDGAQWDFISAPQKRLGGKEFDCDVKIKEKCSLHLHGYTERSDPRSTFSSPSAIGLMLGIGNVGEFLTSKANGDLFVTRDGGVTWKMAMEGTYLWDYGDQGSIIVVVKENQNTDRVHYSLDEGENWLDYVFSDKAMVITSITTLPSDNSRNFLLWGKDPDHNDKIVTINLDFTGLTNRQCELSLDDPNSDKRDYYWWIPKHPMQENDCLFGQVTKYHRKLTDRLCFNGPRIPGPKLDTKCECTRRDFEWWAAFSLITRLK